MKKIIRLVVAISIFSLSQTISSYAQDTTNILFMGNSFTFFNSMPNMMSGLCKEAGIPINNIQYTVGGYDFLTNAPSDPVFWANIRAKKWDYVILQDNQGRLVFSEGSFNTGVLAIYTTINDSIKHYSPCAKVVWFGGWGPLGGIPQYFTGDNTIACIRRVLNNSIYVNDSIVHNLVAPIGEGWIKALTYRPKMKLYISDSIHPTPEASFITASIIFTTIFKVDISNFKYKSTLVDTVAHYIRTMATGVVFDTANYRKYGVKSMTPVLTFKSGQFNVTGSYKGYQWYKNETILSGDTSSTYNPSLSGRYFALVKDNSGCYLRTREYVFYALGTSELINISNLSVYPNPTTGDLLIRIDNVPSDEVLTFEFINTLGQSVYSTKTASYLHSIHIDMSDFTNGLYFIRLTDGKNTWITKVIKKD